MACNTADPHSRNDNRGLYFVSDSSPATSRLSLYDAQTADMKEEKLGPEKWVPCQPGTIQEAAKVSPISQRIVFKLLVACTVIAFIGGGTALFSNPDGGHSREFLPAGIACINVDQNLAAYIAGEVEDRELKKRITFHLLKCEGCREKYNGYCCSSDSACGSRPSKATLKPCLQNCVGP